jgi:16S rRNA (guanine(966)-N(2))-methyltransferase RsmD
MAGIRVISGTAKGRKLKMVPGDTTRPVMDRVKQALFNIIGAGIQGASFLDLFGGTGSVGIEALSRGAAQATFVETNRQALKTIQENLQLTALDANARVLRRDALGYLKGEPERSYDFIYIAPPQYQELWSKTLALVDRQPGWLNPDGWAIVQIDPLEYAGQPLQNLTLVDERRYGNTGLYFYERPGA